MQLVTIPVNAENDFELDFFSMILFYFDIEILTMQDQTALLTNNVLTCQAYRCYDSAEKSRT